MIRVIIIILVVYVALYLYTYPMTIVRFSQYAFSGVSLPVIPPAFRANPIQFYRYRSQAGTPPSKTTPSAGADFVRISDARGRIIREARY